MILNRMNSKEFVNIVRKKPLLILPIGAVEAHSSHLPLGTDSVQPEHVAGELEKVLEIPVLIAPLFPYGECSSTRNFPGTASISFDSLRSIIRDIISEFVRNGIKRILVLSGHAGAAHMTALRLAARSVVEEHPEIKMMVLSDYDIAYEMLGKIAPEDDGHAGMIETSRIMDISPELVKKPERKEYLASLPKFAVLSNPEKYWDGARGYPGMASPEKGKEINEYIVRRLAEIVREYFC